MMRISNHLKSVTNPDGATLLDIKSGRFFRLNLLGSRISYFHLDFAVVKHG
jgi:hypothetical protein